MPGPIPFAPPVTLATVQHSCARALTAIEYTWPHATTGFLPSQIDGWCDAVADEDPIALVGLMNGNGIYGMRHLNTPELERFQKVALAAPALRAALLEHTAALENAIGVELPLVVPLAASFVSPSVLPKMGLALFLESAPERVPDAYRGLQIYHLDPDDGATAPDCPSIARIAGKAPLAVAHFAADTIDELARCNVRPTRVVPLSFPHRMPLGSSRCLIGKFSFLGLLPSAGYKPGDIGASTVHEYGADVICIGGLAGYDDDYVETAIERLRPAVVVALTAEASYVDEMADSLVVALNPEQETDAYLTFHPGKQTVTAVVGSQMTVRGHRRRDRLEKHLFARTGAALDALHEKTPALMSPKGRDRVQTKMRADLNALHVAVPHAAEYLDALTGSPRLPSDYAAKAKLLREIIDRMTAAIPVREAAPFFVRAFAALLKASDFVVAP